MPQRGVCCPPDNANVSPRMSLDAHLNQFRIASRELFNKFFRVDDPYKSDRAWPMEERYREVEDMLFQKLVVEPSGLPLVAYGVPNPRVRVELKHGDVAPIMLNREVDSGYWDHSLREVTREAKLAFISFFDWDQLDYRDHRYVRVLVLEWPSQPGAVGKHAFIEAHNVRYCEG